MAGKVTFVKTGGVREFDVKEGMSIQHVLKQAAVQTGKGVEVRLNGKVITDLDASVKAGDQVMVVGEIAGG